MAFLDDIFGAFTGQQSTPQQTIIPTGDLLNQTYGALTAAAPGVIGYNQALAPGLMNVQLGVEKQYDPNAGALRAATSKSILDELGLGTALPQDLQDKVVRQALEGNAASGFGVGQGGRGLVAADLGLTGLDLAKSRRAEAAGYARSGPTPGQLYQPQGIMDPTAIANDIRGVQAAKDEYANMVEDTRKSNFASLLNTGTKILGTAAGAFFGGPAGASIGGSIGGSVIQGGGVRGVPRGTSAGGGGIGSILQGLGGIFNFGGGSQQTGDFNMNPAYRGLA